MKGILLLTLVSFRFGGHNQGITGNRKGRFDGEKQRTAGNGHIRYITDVMYKTK